MPVLPVPVGASETLIDLLRRRPVVGGDAFDLQLAAVMIANDVRRVYTFNVADFAPFEELVVEEPGAASAARPS